MATAACLPIAADRAGPCVRTIFFEGLDFTGVTLALEMRLNPETPGPASIALGMGGSANAEGLRIVGVTVTNGVPTSQVVMRINETTMEDKDKVPYTGELGSSSTLYYDLIGTFGQDKRRLAYGTFTALPTVYGMNAAPQSRPIGYLGGTGEASTWSSARLTFTDDRVTVRIDGADLLGALVVDTGEARDQAVSAAMQTAIDTARAKVSADTAAAADQAVRDNLAGIDRTAMLPIQAVSVAALRDITDRPIGRQARLSEEGRAGDFTWSGNLDLSAVVAIDTARGIYIPPTGQNGSQGAWVRNSAPIWQASWFGLPNAASADDGAVVRAIEALRPAGTGVKFGIGAFKFGNVKVLKPGHWGGSGKQTVAQHVGGSGIDTFDVCCQGGVRISHMRFTGLITPDNANAHFPIYISSRFVSAANATNSEDHEVDHCWFDGCSTGVRVSYAGVYDNGSRTWYTPRRTSIHHCVFSCTYQDIIPESDDVHIYKNAFLRPDTADNSRSFAYIIRILGCRRVTVADNFFDVPASAQMIGIMMATVDASGEPASTKIGNFRNADSVVFRNNRGFGGNINVIECSGVCRIEGNDFSRDLTTTDRLPFVQLGQSSTPIYAGALIVSGNAVRGYSTLVRGINGNLQHLRVVDNFALANAYKGGFFEEGLVVYAVAGTDQAGNLRRAPALIEIIGNTGALNYPCATIPITINGSQEAWANTRIRVDGNTLPFDPSNNPTYLFASMGPADPLIYAGQASGKFDRYSTVLAALQAPSLGSNVRFDADAVTELQKYQRPAEIEATYPPTFA